MMQTKITLQTKITFSLTETVKLNVIFVCIMNIHEYINNVVRKKYSILYPFV